MALCTFGHLKMNILVPYLDISLKLGQSQDPIYSKLQNEALRKLVPFLVQNDTLSIYWFHFSKMADGVRRSRWGSAGGIRGG